MENATQVMYSRQRHLPKKMREIGAEARDYRSVGLVLKNTPSQKRIAARRRISLNQWSIVYLFRANRRAHSFSPPFDLMKSVRR
jgi:hypothetical protein